MIQIISSDFTENTSTDYGGAIYFELVQNFSLYSSKFSNNYFSVYSSNFSNNFAYYGGGALYLIKSQSMLQIVSSIFTDNQSPNYGGAIYVIQFGNISINFSEFNNNFDV